MKSLSRLTDIYSVQASVSSDRGYLSYTKNNEYHRIGGPARVAKDFERKLCEVEYFVDDELHRIDGPAMLNYWGRAESSEYYYIFDAEVDNKESFEEYVKMFDMSSKEAFSKDFIKAAIS